MTNFKRAQRKIRAIVNEAIHERDTKGYRENLGYDQQNRLEEYLNGLDLTYPEHAALIREFYKACDQI